MIAAHLLFCLVGLPSALSALVPRFAAALVFVSELLRLAANAAYVVNRTSVEQALSPRRIQSGRNVFHGVTGVPGLAFGGLLGTALTPAAAIVVGVIGGVTTFIWLVFSPLRDLHALPG